MITYQAKTFNELKANLIEFAKVYFPNNYTDFNESDPGTMFIDMGAYVGDVLSLYQSKLYREKLLLQAQERKNLLSVAQAYGYKPRLNTPSIVDVDLYQIVPATGSGVNTEPDFSYALTVRANSTFTTADQTGIIFRLVDNVDFNIDIPSDPIVVTPYQNNQTTGAPELFLLKKKGRCVSTQINTTTVTVAEPKRFLKIKIDAVDLIGILDVIDSDQNEWVEVPYLVQDTIFDQKLNTTTESSLLSNNNETVPYILRLKRVPRRFITRITQENFIELQFGSGDHTDYDEVIVPNPENVGLPLTDGTTKFDRHYDPSNFFLTRAYGQTPANTTLTIRYLTGGGVNSNVPSNTITVLDNVDLDTSRFPTTNSNMSTLVRTSLAVNNPVAATGGQGFETNESIRQNALSMLHAQARCITKTDYISRAYSMDPKFGSISKCDIISEQSFNLQELKTRNPLTLNMYVLSQDVNNNLCACNSAIKQNLKTYLSQYRAVNDTILIKDAFIINIGINFEIIPVPGTNNNDALIQCINVFKDYFSIDKWQINQPIIMGDLYNAINQLNVVQHCPRIDILNLVGSENGYSDVIYSIKNATKNGIIYPSLDPSIFEIKFPNKDIVGRITTY